MNLTSNNTPAEAKSLGELLTREQLGSIHQLCEAKQINLQQIFNALDFDIGINALSRDGAADVIDYLERL